MGVPYQHVFFNQETGCFFFSLGMENVKTQPINTKVAVLSKKSH